MTARQAAFAEEYLIDLNATQAAIRAGYSPRTAHSIGPRLLEHVEVKRLIAQQMERIRNERTADAQEVVAYLTSVLRGESRSHVLALCGQGRQQVIEKPPDERERLKAAELLGRRHGLFTDRVDVDAQVQSPKLREILAQLGGEGLEEGE